MTLTVGQTLQFRYHLQSVVGRGGMGVVYRAYDPVLQRTVAVKVLPQQLTTDAEFVTRFQREAIASANLRHPHIVTVYDVGQQEGEYFIIMEYLEGSTLEQTLAQAGPLPPAKTSEILAQIASALDHAHSRGIVHRDVKPSNIMLDPQGRAVLMDFGLVRAGEGLGPTRSTMVMGTPEYMAPEQVLGQVIDRRTDIYALGVVVYQMLSGKTPFAHTTPLATAHAHAYEPPPPLRLGNKAPAKPVEAVVMKALAKDPKARYQSAGELARDFAQAASGAMPAGLAAAPAAAASATAAGATQRTAAPPRGAETVLLTPPPGEAAADQPEGRPKPKPWAFLAAGALAVVALLIAVVLWSLGGGGPPTTPTTEPPGVVVAAPTETPSPVSEAATPVPPATPSPVAPASATPTPRALPARSPTATRAPSDTATTAPTDTATPAPTDTATPAPVATATPRPATSPTPPVPGVLLDFETLGAWARGNEPYGTLTQSGERQHSGSASAKLAYAMPAVADNYVVFLRQPPLAIPGRPEALNVWVYGDGSGHFLNAWIQDAQGEVRQFTFGRVQHANSWQQMTLPLDVTAAWPQGNISGSDNGQLDYPVKLYGLVLDVVPDGAASSGVIYLDDLGTGPGAAAPVASTPPPTGSATTAAATAPAAPAALSGHILFTAGNDVNALAVATGNSWPVFRNGRQPDIRADNRVVVNGTGGGRDNLFSVNLNGGGEIMNGMHPEDSYPHWSPSGQSAVFYSTQQGDGVERIYIQWDMSHSEEAQLLRVGETVVHGRDATWLPSWRIAFTGCNYWASGSNCGIWTVDSNGGGNPVQLTVRTDDRSTDGFGGTLLFSSKATGNWEVFAVPVNGGEPRNLTNSPSQDTGATYSPDGSSIAFMSDRDGAWGIWVMNADGSNPRRLLAVPGGFGADWERERLAWGR